ncbi:MAG: RIP metalloprotease RseP [Granulosicoccus sp.]
MFSNVAFSAIAFVVALGILISIHEFGHFWVARRVGVKVLRYSIGFGHTLFKHVGKVDGTEFVIAAIPLGGYVKMLDEREAPVAAHEQHRAFNRQPLWARSAVVVAGPLANFLLAILAYWLVMMMGISGIAPLVAAPEPGSQADLAGFRSEDRIVTVGEIETATWTDARIALLESSLGADKLLDIAVESADGSRHIRQLAVTQDGMLKAQGDAVANLGFSAWWPETKAVIGLVVAGSRGAEAGLQVGDQVLAVDDEPVDSWVDLVKAVEPAAGKRLLFTIERADAPMTLEVTPESVDVEGRTVGRIGVAGDQTGGVPEKLQVKVQHPPLEAFAGALQRTWDMSLLTVRMVGKLLFGEASLDKINGPISIAKVAGQTASIGLDHYINFIALISISLAVLNLLPIPILDGGHLLYFAAEAVRGKPLSERVQIWGQQIGMVLLGSLMFLAFYNDIFGNPV